MVIFEVGPAAHKRLFLLKTIGAPATNPAPVERKVRRFKNAPTFEARLV
jgi:hypothetical protein